VPFYIFAPKYKVALYKFKHFYKATLYKIGAFL